MYIIPYPESLCDSAICVQMDDVPKKGERERKV